MNCLSDEIIQRYIDGELDSQPEAQVLLHLNACKKCTERVSGQRQLGLEIKASIGSLADELTEIPVFVQTKRKKSYSKKIVFRIVYPLAAAGILFFFLSLPDKKNTAEAPDIYILGNYGGEINANLPISEQDFEISFYDENGHMIE